jgi:hypothetical protein
VLKAVLSGKEKQSTSRESIKASIPANPGNFKTKKNNQHVEIIK